MCIGKPGYGCGGVGGVGVWRVCVLFREQSGESGGRVLGTDRGGLMKAFREGREGGEGRCGGWGKDFRAGPGSGGKVLGTGRGGGGGG